MFAKWKVRPLYAVLVAFALATLSLTLSLARGAQAARPQREAPVGGKELFEKRCGGCHALDRNKEGPRLGGVYGRKAGSVESFEYSSALKRSVITWTEETLDNWLTDTEKVIPDNDMAFRVEKADERREIISWLKQNSVQ